MSTTAAETDNRPFITLRPGHCICIHWTGGDHGPTYDSLEYKGGTLADFLKKLEKKIPSVAKVLNRKFAELDQDNPSNPKNRQVLRQFLGIGAWAYAVAYELRPFMEHYRHLPTNFLYVDFIFRLEEIYSRCFVAAHIFGGEDESMVGLRNLLVDFELTGAIAKDGKADNSGVWQTIYTCYMAYVEPNKSLRRYERFAELMEAFANLVVKKYPSVGVVLAGNIKHFAESPRCFGNTIITSPEKTAMLARLMALIEYLEKLNPVAESA